MRWLASGAAGGRRLAPYAAAAALAPALGCSPAPPVAEAPDPGTAPFVLAEAETGLDFTHFNGMSGETYIVEMMGAGVGLFDYDNDGDLDVWLVQGTMLGPGKTLADALLPPAAPGPPTDRLFRNDLERGAGLRFTDVTVAAGIVESGYGMGVSAGDYDNDGWIDVYVTNLGRNRLWRNRGDGTFHDVTEAAGVGCERWGASAAFFDADADGWLDLYLANYVDFDYANHTVCYQLSSAPDYCGPKSYRPAPHRLYRNRRDGGFDDVTPRAGLTVFGAGMGVATADYDGDGRTDVYVANDADDNHLWINLGDGRFEDRGFASGVALNEHGEREAGMGVDAADYDDDGDEDLFVTNLAGETNTLYVNGGRSGFHDATRAARLAAPSLPFTGFGTGFLDYDNDGRLDLFVANGAVRVLPEQAAAGEVLPLRERKHLYRGVGGGRFEPVEGVAALERAEVGRGAAFGDLDNDGDTDVVVANNGGPARLLSNRAGERAHWLGLRLVTEDLRRDVLGARVELRRPGGAPTLTRRVRTDGSYMSSHDPRVLFGLGAEPTPGRVVVRWPGGPVEAWDGLAVDRYYTLARGTGSAAGSGDDAP